MADEAKLIALIEANTKGYENALKRIERATDQTFSKADRSVKRLETNLRASSQQLIGIGRTFATAFGAGFLVGGFAQLPGLIRDTVKQAAGLVDLADKIGITTDALQELRFQADQNGSSAQALDAAMEQFSKRVGLAASGSGELLDILKANGVALRDNAGNLRPLTTLLADYADLIKNAANDQDRAVLATEAFGRAGDEMSSVLRGGSGELARFRDEAHRTNQVVGEDGVRALESYDDRLAKLGGKWSKFWTDAVVVALGALEKIGQAEHFILDPIIAAISDGLTTDAEEARAELAKVEEQIAFMREHIEDNMNLAINDDALNAAIARARELRGIIEAAESAAATIARIDVDGGRGGGGSRGRQSRPTFIPNRAGGAGGGRFSAISDIERQKKAIVELIAEMDEELRLVGASAVQQRIAAELRRAGAQATEEQKAQIAQLVTTIAAEEEAYQRLVDAMDEVRFTAADALSSFNDALRDGEGLAGALNSALDTVLDTLIRIAEQAAITALFGPAGTPGGGVLSGLIGGLFNRDSPGAATSRFSPRTPSVPRLASSRAMGNGEVLHVIRVAPSPLFATTVESRIVNGNAALARRMPGILADRQARGV